MSKSPSNSKKTAFHLPQGFTIRCDPKDFRTPPHVFSKNICGCTIVIIRGKDGKVSTTHADLSANLKFIETELEYVGKEGATIDICALKTRTNLAKTVLEYVKKNHPKNSINSAGKEKVRGLKESEILKGTAAIILQVGKDQMTLYQVMKDEHLQNYEFLEIPHQHKHLEYQSILQYFAPVLKTIPQVIKYKEDKTQFKDQEKNQDTVMKKFLARIEGPWRKATKEEEKVRLIKDIYKESTGLDFKEEEEITKERGFLQLLDFHFSPSRYFSPETSSKVSVTTKGKVV